MYEYRPAAIRRWLQDRPRLLVALWHFAERLLPLLVPIISRFGERRTARVVAPLEEIAKRPLFDCRMCGQCILHYTGMTCPMTCPKQLRNGPCGGVRLDGKCEVIPEMDCVWVKAVERSADTPYALEIGRLNPPVDWRLQGDSSWVNLVTEKDLVITGTGAGPQHVAEVIST